MSHWHSWCLLPYQGSKTLGVCLLPSLPSPVPSPHRPSWTDQSQLGALLLLPLCLDYPYSLTLSLEQSSACEGFVPSSYLGNVSDPLRCPHGPTRNLYQRDCHEATTRSPCKASSLLRAALTSPRAQSNTWHTPGRCSINVQGQGKQIFLRCFPGTLRTHWPWTFLNLKFLLLCAIHSASDCGLLCVIIADLPGQI